MSSKIRIQWVKRWVWYGDDIVLRENSTKRIIFRPLIVENENNPDSNIKWWFIFQWKWKNDKWEDYSEKS